LLLRDDWGNDDRTQTVSGMTVAWPVGRAPAQQPWPSRPLKVVVTFPPGGASDAAARVISGPLSEKLGQTVVVDNKPGGGTTIGANAVLQAKDDHTLLLSTARRSRSHPISSTSHPTIRSRTSCT
jgi:tripartite-type tricarboxylate transporter receptor subunit TctC